MCLALPGRIVSIHERDGLLMALVDVRGSAQEVCLIYVPEAAAGDWVLAHLGVALERLDEERALADLALLAEAGLLEDASLPGDAATA